MFSRNPTTKGVFGTDFSEFPQLEHRTIQQFIDKFSVEVRYWKAIQCPCLNERTGQPDITCNSCRGLGWYYGSHETDQKYLRAMVHSRRATEKTLTPGRVVTGYASITFLPGVIPGDGDLVQVCRDREVINNEVHTRGEKLMDGSTGEKFRFRDVICAETVTVYDKAHNQISVLPVDKWTFNQETRMLDFVDLPVGAQYSVRYLAVPEYVVMANTAKPLLRVTHDDGLPVPCSYKKDIVYPFNCQANRLDRAILSRQRGEIDQTTQSTFTNQGVFR